MSSTRRHDTHFFHVISIAFALAAALFIALALGAPQADAAKKKSKTSATAKKKLPKITKVTPKTDIAIGQTLKLQGKNFVKGKKKLIVMFKRDGSKRRFTARGTATSSTRGTVVVPDVGGDLVRSYDNTIVTPLDNLYRLRAITKFGAAKEWTNTAISPTIAEGSVSTVPVNTGASGDCDKDGVKNGFDQDDDGDLLDDTIELSIGTDVCKKDTDGDVLSDYYEYTVAFTLNGGPTLPYPGAKPYPNPLDATSDANADYDDDRMTTIQEYSAWQYTGLISRFYSDADADSDGDGTLDPAEDEDNDLLPNHIESYGMGAELNWLKTDTDGDGLCDGLDDQDHDGPPTPLAVADCSTRVPNNGPLPAFPPSDPADHAPGVIADPDAGRIDGDDNRYSNFYEWYNAGADPNEAPDVFDQCVPSIYPVSPFCHTGMGWDPFP